MGNDNSELYLAGNSGQSSSFKKPELHLTQYPTVVFAGSEKHEIKLSVKLYVIMNTQYI